MCVKLSAGKSESASSVSVSQHVDEQLVGTESGSTPAVSSSRRRSRHSEKSSRKRPSEVFIVTRILCSYSDIKF